jgi:uncharacterized protein YegL
MQKFFMILLAGLLASTGVRAQEVYVDNVVIVLDASGSMNERMSGTSICKINAAKTAIKEVLRNTPPATQIGLLVFGQENGWQYPLGPRDDTRLFQSIDRVIASGSTPLGDFIKRGADRLLEARKDQFGYGSYRLLIVTDGEASDQNLVNSYTPDVISRGILVDVIGVNMSQDHTLARKVHSYRRANDPAALSRAIREVFAEVGSGSGDLSGNEAFAELQGLPAEAASAILKSLTVTGNEPIGDRMAASSQSVPQSYPVTSPSFPSHQNKKHGFNGFPVLLIILVIGISIISKMIRKG